MLSDIKGNTITVGQTLVILPISGIQHVVKSGDTLQSIAKLHKGDLDEVLQYNNLAKNSKLAIGDVIVVPDGEVVSISSGSKSGTSGSKSSPAYVGYYMRPIVGDISKKLPFPANKFSLVLSLDTFEHINHFIFFH